jgi:hypothetical protein
LTEGLDTLLQLNAVSYIFNSDMNMGDEIHFGFIAEEVDAISTQFATHDRNGNVYGLDSTAILAVTVNAIKELNLKVSDLSSLDTTSANSLGSLIKNFLADVGNGLEKIFVKEVNTDTLCISDASGAKTCINKAQLDALLSGSGVVVSDSSGSSGGGDVPPSVDEDLATAKTEANGKIEADYTPESWATFTTALATALELPETNDEEKIAKTTVINDAVGGLELLVVEEVVEPVVETPPAELPPSAPLPEETPAEPVL